MEFHGKIIRIVDKTTAIINLGKNHGIKDSSIFSIIGNPEPIIDPFDLQPRKAKSETPVRVGDIVEVEVTGPSVGKLTNGVCIGSDQANRLILWMKVGKRGLFLGLEGDF